MPADEYGAALTFDSVVAHHNIVEFKRTGKEADRAAVTSIGISPGFGQGYVVDGQFAPIQQKEARVAIAVVVAVAADGPALAVDGDGRGDRGQNRGQPERVGGLRHVDDVGAGLPRAIRPRVAAADVAGRLVGFPNCLRQAAAAIDVDVRGVDRRQSRQQQKKQRSDEDEPGKNSGVHERLRESSKFNVTCRGGIKH